MITYRIVSSTGKHQTISKVLNPTDPNFRQSVFERALKHCGLKEGERVKLRGTAKRGNVVMIETDFKKIKWEKMRPLFVVVDMDELGVFVAHPCQLKRSKT